MTQSRTMAPSDEVPEGMNPDARTTWPNRELIESFLGDHYQIEIYPGGTTVEVESEEAAQETRRFRDVLGRFASGVTVITAMAGGEPVGMTAQSFTSVSLDPPLVLFCPAKSSRAWPAIRASGRFCVNLLAHDQAELSTQMATRGASKFTGVGWEPAPATGSPLLHGVVGYVDCSIFAVHEAGDHYVVIGSVLDLAEGDTEHGLTFYRGRYGTTAD